MTDQVVVSPPKVGAPRPHPLQSQISGELHARPSFPVTAPSVVLRVVLMTDEMTEGEDRDFVARLCNRFNTASPASDSRWYAAKLGDVLLRWERHTEMSTLTLLWSTKPDAPLFESRVPPGWPANWLEGAPGYLLGATHIEIREQDLPDRDAIQDIFPDGVALTTPDRQRFLAASNFKLDEDGFSKIVVWAREIETNELGRRVQRLFEIETYRLAAMLSFPTANGTRSEFSEIEAQVEEVMAGLASEDTAEADADLLRRVTSMSARVEALSARTSYRYAAGRAYHRLVNERLESLSLRPEEGTIMQGLPSYNTFLKRRLEPAMRTCDAMEERQNALVDRIARATRLLATRVEVRMGEQNAELLASMNTRARHQLRLQETVEGLSVFAISYYAVGLISYLAKAGDDLGLPIKYSLVTGFAVPVVVTILWLGLRRFHKSLAKDIGDDKH